jgi:hypothetical protein
VLRRPRPSAPPRYAPGRRTAAKSHGVQVASPSQALCAEGHWLVVASEGQLRNGTAESRPPRTCMWICLGRPSPRRSTASCQTQQTARKQRVLRGDLGKQQTAARPGSSSEQLSPPAPAPWRAESPPQVALHDAGPPVGRPLAPPPWWPPPPPPSPSPPFPLPPLMTPPVFLSPWPARARFCLPPWHAPPLFLFTPYYSLPGLPPPCLGPWPLAQLAQLAPGPSPRFLFFAGCCSPPQAPPGRARRWPPQPQPTTDNKPQQRVRRTGNGQQRATATGKARAQSAKRQRRKEAGGKNSWRLAGAGTGPLLGGAGSGELPGRDYWAQKCRKRIVHYYRTG